MSDHNLAKTEFIVKDSGERQEFDSGMVRDTTEGKTDYWRVFVGPLVERLAVHLTKGAAKYPDYEDGKPNWTRAAGIAELGRFRFSALRHFLQWFRGDCDEDHFAAVVFNMNGAEYVEGKMALLKNAATRPGEETGGGESARFRPIGLFVGEKELLRIERERYNDRYGDPAQ